MEHVDISIVCPIIIINRSPTATKYVQTSTIKSCTVPSSLLRYITDDTRGSPSMRSYKYVKHVSKYAVEFTINR